MTATGRPSVLVVTTGGTISMASVPGGGVAPQLGAEALLSGTTTDCDVVTHTVRTVPGAYLTMDDVIELAGLVEEAAECGHRGVVVVQGTDTIEEVAFALDLVADPRVTTVVTGAMRSASTPGADGAANLSDAIAVAADSECRGLGVLVVLGGEIHAASLVRKAHTVAPHAFESWPGLLGWVSEGAPSVVLQPRHGRHRLTVPTGAAARTVAVALVTARLGATESDLRRAVEPTPDALVVEGLGAGHVPPTWVDALEHLAGMRPVVLCSRTRRGPLLSDTYAFRGSERDLLERGVVGAGHLDAPKAVVALDLLLRTGADRDAITRFFRHAPS